jgi:hypothetical protein
MWGGIVRDPVEQMMIRRREYAGFVLSEMGFYLVSTRNEDLFCVSAIFSIFSEFCWVFFFLFLICFVDNWEMGELLMIRESSKRKGEKWFWQNLRLGLINVSVLEIYVLQIQYLKMFPFCNCGCYTMWLLWLFSPFHIYLSCINLISNHLGFTQMILLVELI